MSKAIITFEFDIPEENSDLKRQVLASSSYNVLFDLDQEIKSTLKYGEHDWLNTEAFEYLRNIREQISESGLLDE